MQAEKTSENCHAASIFFDFNERLSCPVSYSQLARRNSRADGINNFPSRWQQPKKSQGPSVNYRIAIHQYLEFTIAPVDRFNFSVQLTSKLRRHTDGV